MIERFYTSTAAILRKVPGTDYDGNYEQVEVEIAEFPCHIQQATAEMATYVAQSISRTYAIWCGVNTPVREGDRLQIVSDLYTVRAIMRNGVGANQHLELVVVHGGTAD
jgi:hypothetical protein